MAFGGYTFLDKLSQTQAKHLYEEGAKFVLLYLPAKSVFGIDNNSWEVGEKFKGVKMIPPGVHFIFCQSVGKEGCTGPVIGFFRVFKPKELLVKEWDVNTEVFSPKECSEEELNRIKSDLHLYEPCLAPFPYDNLKTWISLTNHVTRISLEMLHINERFFSAFEVTEHGKSDNEESIIKFTHIPLPSVSKGASPIEITRAYMDQSPTLLQCLKCNYQDNCIYLLGEFQCCFLLFVYGHVYEGFEQWRRIIDLLCACDEALISHSQLYSHFLSILHFQLDTIPMDFLLFNDEDAKHSEHNIFLIPKLDNLFLNLKESTGVSSDLRNRADKFRSTLIHKFKWSFEVSEEDLPVVVDI